MSEAKDRHVVPKPDREGHVLSPDCWCGPRVEVYGSGRVIVHNRGQ